jgi:A nuclease family of the HNH/ENDO VII superfamily with conserved AHH
VASGSRIAGAVGGSSGNSQGLATQIGEAIDGVVDRLSYIFKSDSASLARNMALEDGLIRDKGEYAHHILAAGALAAQPARDILSAVGMNINSAFNGVLLNGSYHSSLHTTVYYTNVNEALAGAKTYEAVAARLTVSKAKLQAGTFPFK